MALEIENIKSALQDKDEHAKLLDEISGIFKLLFAILSAVSVLLIIGTTLVIKISNSGMMYR